MIQVKRCRNCDCYITLSDYIVYDGYCSECYDFIVDDKLELKEENDAENKTEKGKEMLKEFEHMKTMAELKALSNISLERPLSDQEFDRMIELKNILIKEGEQK